MKFISIHEKFLHGGQTFYPGEVRCVDDETFEVATKAGWAGVPGAPVPARAAPLPASLDVQNSTTSVRSDER